MMMMKILKKVLFLKEALKMKVLKIIKLKKVIQKMKIWNFQISNPEERKDEEEKDTKGSHKIKSKHGKHQDFIFFNFNVFFGCLIRIYFL